MSVARITTLDCLTATFATRDGLQTRRVWSIDCVTQCVKSTSKQRSCAARSLDPNGSRTLQRASFGAPGERDRGIVSGSIANDSADGGTNGFVREDGNVRLR